MPSSPSRRRTRLAWLLVAGVLLAAAAAALWPRARGFELVEARNALLLIERSDRGTTRMREIHPLTAPAAGVLERIELEAGDRVEAGQILARLRPLVSTPLDARSTAEAQAAAVQAEAALRQVQAQAASAADARRRLEASATRGLVSERDLVAARALDREASAAVEVARAALAQARSRIALVLPDARGRIELPAAVTGVVLRRLLQGEQVVEPGRLLLEIGTPDSLEVVGDFLSQDAVLFKVGAVARIEGWGGASLPARVERIEPLGELKVSALGVEEQRVRVILSLEQIPPALGHGYQVEAFVRVREQADALLLPIEALRREDSGWKVWTLQDGRVRGRSVEVGDSDGRRREILSGLSPGEQVLAFPPPGDLEGLRGYRLD
ncbi:efflux RND transporter periplasmic adaptor subunit [Aquimonas sp.]|jgi:HlyD family secretion protein|uniref:efflux RND transporter periplasmic adaptor subunit n=1 Tax=Aquimonas sp. TaxID=1872588 RepID=UPI0037BF0326